MAWKSGGLCAVALWLACGWGGAIAAPVPQPPDFGPHAASADTRQVAQWAMRSGDPRGGPFAIVDKKDARLYVFDGQGKLRGVTAVLLGEAAGDSSAAHVGIHTQTGKVPLHERTTPAGRFVSQPGRNLAGEPIVWVDYESAFAIHRLRPGPAHRSRARRLASATPLDNRASLGCVVVPVAFYKSVVSPLLGHRRGLVYVLPEAGPVHELFTSF